MLRQRTLRDLLVMAIAPPILVAAAISSAVALQADGDPASTYGLITLGATLAAGLTSAVVSWLILRKVERLAVTTGQLAEAQLEAAAGHRPIEELPKADGGSAGDALTQVAVAVNHMAGTSAELAESQRRSIRKGLSTMVINLARRNQSLLDRQVEYLDELEQREEDPDRLAQLFRVDHLSTRMRRNAESLLVLAGADPGRRKGAPVAVSDVLRVAIGEVEDYQHVELGAIDDGQLPAGAAVDLAHLAAELMENATQFSPPSAPVDVTARADHDAGCYIISIIDRGMGLGDRLDSANATLAEPPELGLDMGRSLGFIVIGRLAQRLGARVELRDNEGSGTIAEVRVPIGLLDVEPPVPQPATADAPDLRTDLPPPPRHRAEPSTALEKLLGISSSDPTGQAVPAGSLDFPAPTEPPVSTAPPLSSLPPPGGRPDPDPTTPGGPQPTTGGGSVEPGAEVDWQNSSPFGQPSGASWTPPPVTPAPRLGDQPAGLSEALPTGSAFEHGVQSLLSRQPASPPGHRPDADDATGGLRRRQRGASNVPIGEGRPVAAPKRTPEEVRDMLSRYRDGLRGRPEATSTVNDEQPDDQNGFHP